jgi:hypothetical protein
LGNSGDEVVTTGFNGLATKKTVNGVTYSIYTHSDANTGANAELWVQKGVVHRDTMSVNRISDTINSFLSC